MAISYCVQPSPDGLAQAFILGRRFVGDHPSALILGDNIFHGNEFHNLLRRASGQTVGATTFAYHVNDPERYGVVDFDASGRALSIEEKPRRAQQFRGHRLYFTTEVCDIAAAVKPSARGELEITDVNATYLRHRAVVVEVMGRGYAWLDTGTHDSLRMPANYPRPFERRQGLKIAAPKRSLALRLDDSQRLENSRRRCSRTATGSTWCVCCVKAASRHSAQRANMKRIGLRRVCRGNSAAVLANLP